MELLASSPITCSGLFFETRSSTMTTLHWSLIWKLQMDCMNVLKDWCQVRICNKKKNLIELPIYKSASGFFGIDFAKSQRKTWHLVRRKQLLVFIFFYFKLRVICLYSLLWICNSIAAMYGHSAPNLQQLAVKILSLTCSASRCECN